MCLYNALSVGCFSIATINIETAVIVGCQITLSPFKRYTVIELVFANTDHDEEVCLLICYFAILTSRLVVI